MITISPSNSTTFAHISEFNNAVIIGGTQTDGEFQLKALRAKPTMDIPILIVYGGVLDAN